LKWTETHRTIGNHLFSQGKYLEAMDVYMTCLVGLDQRTQTQEGATENIVVDHQCILEETKTQTVNQDGESSLLDEKIKLPILLNLSACMLKLGMFRKTEKIINLCLETVPCSSTNPKVFYRRGRARAFMGLYNDARSDYNQALGLLSPSSFDKDPSDEIQTIHRAIRKLDQLIENARQNHVKQKKAMRRLLGGQSTQIVQPLDSYDIALVDNHGSPEESYVKAPLYKESSTKTRTYSTLKAFKTSTPSYEKSEIHHDHQDSKVASRIPSIGVKQYLFMILAKIIQFLLSWWGDEPR
jgi:tetratricopeptide (TPR) repeat protein